MSALPPAIASVLDRGEFCHVAARTERGPHLTPLVFVRSARGVWVTTSRGSMKGRAWASDPAVGGLVRDGDDAVTFVGRARTYDLLDTRTWGRTFARSATVTAASLRFSRKNARFFAGYAVDARHVPLAWTPPGRVFVELELEQAALVRGGAVTERWRAPVSDGPSSRAGFRAIRAPDAFLAMPGHVRRALGEDGIGALALDAEAGPAVLPVRWLADDGPIHAVASVEVLGLAGAGAGAGAGGSRAAALAIDRPSWWRARRMLGCMVQATADVYVLSEVATGRRALASAIARAGGDADRDALVRLRPRRVVWWEGWTSASVMVA